MSATSENYAEECLNLEKTRIGFKEAARKASCEAQWESIKKKFLKWRESGAKKYTRFSKRQKFNVHNIAFFVALSN